MLAILPRAGLLLACLRIESERASEQARRIE